MPSMANVYNTASRTMLDRSALGCKSHLTTPLCSPRSLATALAPLSLNDTSKSSALDAQRSSPLSPQPQPSSYLHCPVRRRGTKTPPQLQICTDVQTMLPSTIRRVSASVSAGSSPRMLRAALPPSPIDSSDSSFSLLRLPFGKHLSSSKFESPRQRLPAVENIISSPVSTPSPLSPWSSPGCDGTFQRVSWISDFWDSATLVHDMSPPPSAATEHKALPAPTQTAPQGRRLMRKSATDPCTYGEIEAPTPLYPIHPRLHALLRPGEVPFPGSPPQFTNPFGAADAHMAATPDPARGQTPAPARAASPCSPVYAEGRELLPPPLAPPQPIELPAVSPTLWDEFDASEDMQNVWKKAAARSPTFAEASVETARYDDVPASPIWEGLEAVGVIESVSLVFLGNCVRVLIE